MSEPTVPTTELEGMIDFLRAAEQLKDVTRNSWTSSGKQESVAEHSWRLCLMALLFHHAFPEVDLARLLKICIVHDLGEAIGGDVPAVAQLAEANKAARERRDLLQLISALPEPLRLELTVLWDEYENVSSNEARLAKALDKLETILQHNQGANPDDFDYRFNLEYGKTYTEGHSLTASFRELLDRETEVRLAEAKRTGAKTS